jgi:hypothetical protein
MKKSEAEAKAKAAEAEEIKAEKKSAKPGGIESKADGSEKPAKPDGGKKKRTAVVFVPPDALHSLAEYIRNTAAFIPPLEITSKQRDLIVARIRDLRGKIDRLDKATKNRKTRSAAALEKKKARLKKLQEQIAKDEGAEAKGEKADA